MAEDDVLLVERDGRIAILTLNRPRVMNALSVALRNALSDAITALDADPDIGAIVLTGAGTRAFTAGLDLQELARDGGLSVQQAKNPVAAIEACGTPIIIAINGLAITGGMAAGDSLVQQFLGHGLASRLSARLGEGVLNGLLTARVGLSAMAVCRPLPFAAKPAPGLKDVAPFLFGDKKDED